MCWLPEEKWWCPKKRSTYETHNNYIFVVLSKEDCVLPGKVAVAKEDDVPLGEVIVAENIGERKRTRILKELESLEKDNAGKSERDRTALWRKLQKVVSRNEDIATEYV